MIKKIIIALDDLNKEAILNLVKKLSPEYCRLKIGKAIFTAYGPDLVRDLILRGFEIFLDLKFHDIPHQVAESVKAAAQLGVWMTNVHASGGLAMLSAAMQALIEIEQKTGKRPLLIGVTVLTSLSQVDIEQIGYTGNLQDQVLRLAKLCSAACLDGVVCSAHEAGMIKENLGAHFLTITPGIRLADDIKDDQKRIMTPALAIQHGADFLVIGRPITQAIDPMQVVQQVIQHVIL